MNLEEQLNDARRFVVLQGGFNFREFGGYHTRTGDRVKWGQLFRCGALSAVPESHTQHFDTLGIEVICDLRRDAEVEREPTPSAIADGRLLRIPIDPGSTLGIQKAIGQQEGAAHLADFMAEVTRELAREHHDSYRELFSALIGSQGGFLPHCSAGKDRTGFGAAMILAALGVDEDTILADYLLSNRALDHYRNRRSPIRDANGDVLDEASLQAVAGVQERYLLGALHELHRLHGNVDTYLDSIGVGAPVREGLRERLLE